MVCSCWTVLVKNIRSHCTIFLHVHSAYLSPVITIFLSAAYLYEGCSSPEHLTWENTKATIFVHGWFLSAFGSQKRSMNLFIQHRDSNVFLEYFLLLSVSETQSLKGALTWEMPSVLIQEGLSIPELPEHKKCSLGLNKRITYVLLLE